jgi:hypothetical protein
LAGTFEVPFCTKAILFFRRPSVHFGTVFIADFSCPTSGMRYSEAPNSESRSPSSFPSPPASHHHHATRPIHGPRPFRGAPSWAVQLADPVASCRCTETDTPSTPHHRDNASTQLWITSRGLKWGTLFPKRVSLVEIAGVTVQHYWASAMRWSGSMAKEEKTAVSDVSKSQAQRLLEVARARKSGGSGQYFAQSMGQSSLRRDGRKTAKGGVGGGAEGA